MATPDDGPIRVIVRNAKLRVALWAEFDAEMNRLYAIMNRGKEPDLGD
jgi:hypothetical protein